MLFEPGNHRELADRIEEVLNDPALAASLRTTAAKMLSEHYTWDAIAKSTSSVYATAVSRLG